ncbi:MAG: Holliday junction branch migration DNA helicase RuvB, partial [Armatimonadota bacterium]
MDKNRLLGGGFDPEDDSGEYSLRPKRLSEYIGQRKIKENLGIAMAAAKLRDESLDHLLLHGPPGLGKTSLANVISNEMSANLRATSGPAIERPGDLVAILTNLEENAVLFIDEIHRLNRLAEEFLYPAMEDFEMDVVIGKGPSARTVKVPLPKFTLIGATTRPGLLTNPLRDRFGIQMNFEFYTPEDLQQIITRSAEILKVPIDTVGAREIALRARGTPRIANRLLKRVRDYAQVRADGEITQEVADAALKMQGVDEIGLDEFDRRFLRTLIEKFEGGPAGAETMAATLQEERDTIEDVYEPYLMMLGFLNRTPRGRVATRGAYEHLGFPYRPKEGPG